MAEQRSVHGNAALGGVGRDLFTLCSCWGWSLTASARWNHHSWGFHSAIFVFPWTFDSWVPPEFSSTLKQLKQSILSPALLCYTSPSFLSFQWLQGTKISINCQILRELGWVFSKRCQGCGNHFVAAWCCLRRFPEMQLSCKCRSWCLKSSGEAQIRGVVSGLFSSHVTSQWIFFCTHYLPLDFLLFHSRDDPKLVSGSRTNCVR